MGLLERNLQKIAEKEFEGKLAIYSAKISNINDGFHIEIELDGKNDPRGAVNINECSQFSQILRLAIDDAIQGGDSDWKRTLPEDFTVDNYSMEVSSAGVNRKLKLPGDLRRFIELPIEIKYNTKIDHDENAIIVKDVVMYIEGEKELIFQKYKKKQKKRIKGKKKHDDETTFILNLNQIIEARLYLDF